MKAFHRTVLQKGEQISSTGDKKFFSVKSGGMPKKLYKYRVANEYLFKMLNENQLYYAGQDSFNDPLDGINAFKLEFTKEDIDDFFSKLSINQSDPKKRKEEHQLLTKYYQNHADKFENFIRESWIDDIKRFGISCFTSKHDNFLMWSHYGDNHKGVCIEFDFTEEFDLVSAKQLDITETFLFSFRKVIYTDSVPIVPLKEILQEQFSPVYHKAKVWEYEDEYRSIRETVGFHSFDPLCIKGIYCGWKTTDETTEKIKEVLKDNKYRNVFLKRMVARPGTYDLEISNE